MLIDDEGDLEMTILYDGTITWLSEISKLLQELKPSIADDYRASDNPEDDVPGMSVTIATDNSATEWAYQTGDNCYTGACYFFPHWAVVSLYRDSDIGELLDDIERQLLDAMEWEG